MDPLWHQPLRRWSLLRAAACAAIVVLLAACTTTDAVGSVVVSNEHVAPQRITGRQELVELASPTPPITTTVEAFRATADHALPVAPTPTPTIGVPPVVDEIEHLIPFRLRSSHVVAQPTVEHIARISVVPTPAARVVTIAPPVTRVVPRAIPTRPPGLEKIQHFVFIMQENRSFDSYFGTYPGADGIPPGVCLENPAGGPCIAPYHDTSDVNRGGPHDLADALADIDHGRMDGFVAQAYAGKVKNHPDPCPPTRETCPPGQDPRDVMGWHDDRDIPNYWNYAHLYVLQDHMFSSAASFTLPNRLYLLSAQSGGYVSHGQPRPAEYRFPEITATLARHRIDWKYYVTSGTRPGPDGRVVGTPAEQELHPYQYTFFNPLPAFASIQTDPEQRRRIVDTAQFYVDAQTGHLPQVCWVVPTEEVSEHPPYSIREGMAYVTGLVNAVMEGPDWSTTAIFISYDEWGGFYDHVPPTRVDEYGLGIRVPGLVISPYARQGFIDHTVHSSASWLRIVEERFGLEPLTARDAGASDMIEDFDFSQNPRPPVILSATTRGSPYPQPLQTIQHPRSR